MARHTIFNGYTPLAEFAGNVVNDLFTVRFVDLPIEYTVCSFTNIANESSGADFVEKPVEVDAEFGACLFIKGADSSATGTCIIQGFDYLGQPVTEEVTVSGDGVNTKKAFKYIKKVFVTSAKSTTFTVTRKNILGLPYRTSAVLSETVGGVKSSKVTLTVPVNVTQTATTGDPRGTISVTDYTTPATIVLVCVASPEIFTINEKKVGGLFGIPHFSI